MKSALIITTILVLTFAGFIAYNFINNSKQDMNKPIDISPAEFQEMIQDEPGVVIDVRTDQEYNSGHLSLAQYQYDFSGGEFAKRMDSLDKNKTYYLYCRTGNRSGQAARLMKENGFENVYNVGGFEDLADEGFETK